MDTSRTNYLQTEQANRLPYAHRITTFIDFLCWTRDVRSLEAGRTGLFLPMEAVLRHISNSKADIDQKRNQSQGRHDARMTQFSDSIVLSYEPSPDAAARALWDAAFVGQVMLRAGFLPRGCMTLGPLYHTDAAMFGGAFLDAHQLEKNVAITPRILVSDPVVDLAHQFLATHPGPESQKSCTRLDADSRRYLHVLSKHWSFLEKERAEERAAKFEGNGITMMFEELCAMLPMRLKQAETAEQCQKIYWMRDYVNAAIEEHGLDLKVTLPSP
jgi:hypothetical protein